MRARYPVAALEDVAAYRLERWRQERKLRAAVQEFRSRMYEVLGMTEPKLFKARVQYDAEGFSVLTSIVAADPDPWRAYVKVSENQVCRRLLNQLRCDCTVAGIQDALRTPEFEAYRWDKEHLECIAASEKAYASLPQVMASMIVREHRYWEARRKLKSIDIVGEEARSLLLQDGGLDEDDLAEGLKHAAMAGHSGERSEGEAGDGAQEERDLAGLQGVLEEGRDGEGEGGEQAPEADAAEVQVLRRRGLV